MPIKLTGQEFDKIVKKAIRRIPSEIRVHLDNLVISVQKRPSRALLRSMDLPDDDDLLGLFQGVPLIERSVTEPPLYPDSILLFQEPLQSICETLEELEEEIEITIVHEVAHFIGMTEERLEELGYA